MDEDYRTINRASWDERAPAHAASRDYDVERFVTDPEHLSSVVRFDVPRLGDLAGVRGVHCSATSAPTPSRCPGWVPR